MYLYNVGTAVIIWLIVLGTINAGISNGSIGMIFLGVIILISAIALEQIRKQKNKGKEKNVKVELIQKTNQKEQSSHIENTTITKDRNADENIIESTPTNKQKEPISSKIKEVFANIGWFFLVFFIILILAAIFEFLKSLFGLY
jgi:ATP-dependent Zn protease